MLSQPAPIILLFYNNEKELYRNLSKKVPVDQIVKDLSGRPWNVQIDDMTFMFMIVPELDEVPGLLLSLRHYNIKKVIINEEPDIPPRKMSGAIAIARQFHVEPTIFTGYK